MFLTAAVAIDPALWAISFALASSRRQLLMAYWLVLLASAVPLIHWVSAANAMPTILIRWEFRKDNSMLLSKQD